MLNMAQQKLPSYIRYTKTVNVVRTKLRAAFYMRYSTAGQTEQSIEGQRDDITAYCISQGYEFVGEYIDRGISGTKEERPEFQRMISDCEKDLFDVVIVWKSDRFARSREIASKYKKLIRGMGIKVESAMEPNVEGPCGILFEGQTDAYNEYFIEYTKQNVARGKRKSAQKGKFNGGGVPWGLKVNKTTKLYEIDETIAPIIREMFSDYASGISGNNIAKKLNSRGIKTMLGTTWDRQKVLQVLDRLCYGGWYVWGKFIIPDLIPAIVDKKTFEAVMYKKSENKDYAAKHKGDERYILTKKLFCGECGLGFQGSRHAVYKKTGRNRRYYKCPSRKKGIECETHSYRADFLEDLVFNVTQEQILQEDVLERIAEMVYRSYTKESNVVTIIDSLEYQLKEVKRALGANLKMAEQAALEGLQIKSILVKIQELEEQQEQIQNQINREKILHSQEGLTKEKIFDWLMQLKYGDNSDKEYRERVIDTFVKKIYLDNDKMTIIYNVTGSKQECGIDIKTLEKLDKQRNTANALKLVYSDSKRSISNDCSFFDEPLSKADLCNTIA